ncbi:hypothetical protein B7P43_G02184 [Cryptotermes secundus]|uniref:Uncharacterized protein n=1 Tax=Cryptotermes secundus TaxID=105785 RepID=A0A2J7RIN4_9NEOP|nr:hypothetical protein B7P43_G02184 [Cryptotermes secundus]
MFQTTVTFADSVKSLRVFLDSKLYFHNHINSQEQLIFIKLIGLVRSLTFNFSSLECMFILYMLYFTLNRSNVKYESVIWNYVTSTDTNWNALSRILRPSVLYIYILFIYYTAIGF